MERTMQSRIKVRKAFTGEHALQYDRKSSEANWLDPDIIFGLAFRYVSKGDSILDLGIGSGLASVLFYQSGLQVHGLDFSSEMLAVCEKKNFACSLREHDLGLAPYPFKDSSINHAVCTGVTHIFEDLDTIFSETGRILKQDGTFGFVVADGDVLEPDTQALSCQKNKNSRVRFHRHSQATLNELYHKNGFEQLNSLSFTSSAIGRMKRTFKACIVRKK
ncbi:class I SAM-dependent DNA methyltransferase [Maridesulfovibrio sp.]|uniref:class I SAM-dependent DNA methyltransferase n=2 Tax=Maridesulfovibrio TaxID=2794998 RepID=UPI003AFFEC15